jgi:hypothetical protein
LKPTSPSEWQVVHVHPLAPAKPRLGERCNGCGVCCLAEPCPLGVLVSRRRHGACSALRWDDKATLYRCGMVSEPQAVLGRRWQFLAPLVRRLARRWISAGSGCDASIRVQAR